MPESLENQDEVIVTNSFAERIRSYFRDSVMEPNWIKDEDDQNENGCIMGASEHFIRDNHANIPAISSVEFAHQNGDHLREHFETNNLLRASKATKDGPID